MQPGIFVTHKVVSGTFPSLIKVALGKHGIYLLLRIGITRDLFPKKNFLTFFGNFHQFT